MRYPIGSLRTGAGQVGLEPDRVIYVDACDEKSVLACFEEGVRHGGVGVVVAEVARLSMTASRRLTLAAEASGSMAIAIRRWRRQSEAADFGQLDGVDDALAGVGRPVCAASGAGSGARPLVARTNRGGKCGLCSECVQWRGHLDLPGELVDRPAAAQVGRRSA